MQTAEEKHRQWTEFYQRAQDLLKRGPGALRALTRVELSSLIDE